MRKRDCGAIHVNVKAARTCSALVQEVTFTFILANGNVISSAKCVGDDSAEDLGRAQVSM